jgi:hypothetical protein
MKCIALIECGGNTDRILHASSYPNINIQLQNVFVNKEAEVKDRKSGNEIS